MRALYRILSIVAMGRAVSRGPTAMAKAYTRRKAHKATARATRKAGL